jgi:hypothetical protein
MTQKHWHITVDGEILTLSRGAIGPFDFYASVLLQGQAFLRRGRVAHQVRQDLWRALQSLRGYSPMVQVQVIGQDLEIKAGGTVQGRFPRAQTQAIVADVLSCPRRQARWIRSAQRKPVECT